MDFRSVLSYFTLANNFLCLCVFVFFTQIRHSCLPNEQAVFLIFWLPEHQFCLGIRWVYASAEADHFSSPRTWNLISSRNITLRTLGISETFSEVLLCQKYFHNNTKTSFALSLCWLCTDDTNAMVGKMAGTLAQIKSVAPNCISNHHILHCYGLLVKD